MTNVFETMLDDILADPLAQLAHADNPVGYIGLDIPLDLMLACGRRFCHLPWHKSRPTPEADKWLENSFPGWARSMLEDWFSGAFDRFEQVVFTRGDDASQRLYYYVCELQRRQLLGGPEPLIFDMANIPRASSVKHCMRSIRKLMSALAIDETDLLSGIDRANASRRLFGFLDQARIAPGRLYEKIARASLFADLHGAITEAELPVGPGSPGLLLVGSVPPDDCFHVAAETAGWNVIGEVHQRTLARYGPPIEIYANDPVAAIAMHANSCTSGPRCFGNRAARLQSELFRTGAQAVVLWLTEADDALAWDVAGQVRVVQDLGVPALIMTRRQWDGSDDAEDEIQAFLQELAA